MSTITGLPEWRELMAKATYVKVEWPSEFGPEWFVRIISGRHKPYAVSNPDLRVCILRCIQFCEGKLDAKS